MSLVFNPLWLRLVEGTNGIHWTFFYIEFLVLVNHYLEDVLAIEQNSQGLILNLSLFHCGQIFLLFSFFAIWINSI